MKADIGWSGHDVTPPDDPEDARNEWIEARAKSYFDQGWSAEIYSETISTLDFMSERQSHTLIFLALNNGDGAEVIRAMNNFRALTCKEFAIDDAKKEDDLKPNERTAP